MPRKRILHDLTLDKIAAVDFPCQEPATVAILKRNYTAAQRKEMAGRGVAMPDGRHLIADRQDLRASLASAPSPAPDVKAHITARAKALDATDELPADWAGNQGDDEMNDNFSAKVAALRRDGLARCAAMSKAASAYPELLAKHRQGVTPEESAPDQASIAKQAARQNFHAEVRKLAASTGIPRFAAMSRLAREQPDLHARAFG